MAPRLVVFDLDFTLWDCGGTWCDCSSPPYRGSGDAVFDSRGGHMRLYPDVRAILDACDAAGLPMALASRTEQPAWARELLSRMGISDRFHWQEIYPSCKTRHFAALQLASGIAYSEMVFFDDEMRNIREVGALGVRAVLVDRGVDWPIVAETVGPSRRTKQNDGRLPWSGSGTPPP